MWVIKTTALFGVKSCFRDMANFMSHLHSTNNLQSIDSTLLRLLFTFVGKTLQDQFRKEISRQVYDVRSADVLINT